MIWQWAKPFYAVETNWTYHHWEKNVLGIQNWNEDITVVIGNRDGCQWPNAGLHPNKKKKILHRHWGPLHGSSPPNCPLSRRGLNPIKPVYNPDQSDGRLNLTASTFNQLGQYTSSPCRRGYCYTELTIFFPNGGRNHRQFSLGLPMEGWPGWVSQQSIIKTD